MNNDHHRPRLDTTPLDTVPSDDQGILLDTIPSDSISNSSSGPNPKPDLEHGPVQPPHIPSWSGRLERHSSRVPFLNKVFLYLRDPKPLLDIDIRIRGRHIVASIDTTFLRFTRLLPNPWLFIGLAAGYIISFAFFARAQFFQTPVESFISCNASTALYNANLAVNFGQVDCALALGFEKMKPGSSGTNFPDRIPPTMLLNVRSHEIEQQGLGENHEPGAPRLFGNGAQEYFQKYGGNIEHLAKIASKNHKHAVNNPYSQFRDGWSVEQVMKAPKITNQLTKFMCRRRLPTFSPPTPLLKAKAAFSFAIHSSIQHAAPSVPAGVKAASIPSLLTQLVVGCRRKVVVYSWKDGEATTRAFLLARTRLPQGLPSPLNATVRILTPWPSSKSPLFFISTPTDKTAAAAEGSTIWQFKMKPWGVQVDELVAAGQYADALALLETIEPTALPDKDKRVKLARGLNAVAQFRSAQFDTAIDTLIALDINPAKVVALYPESVAGRLSVLQDQWIALYGGPAHVPSADSSGSSTPSPMAETPTKEPTSMIPDALEGLTGLTTSGTIRGRLKGLGALLPHLRDEAPAAAKPKPVKQAVHDDLPKSIETLLRYLSDRRPLSHEIAFLSETSVEDLFALPNAPFTALTPELWRFAQFFDTALFKAYLVIRPGLLGSLCRVSNWCEVSEVEEELLARKKYAELRDLYNGKKMHRKALELLKGLSEDEPDMEEKLTPSINYLQKLGPEHLDEIFQSARWIFDKDSAMAFQIFTSEDVELPRPAVADYLESIDPALCIRYIEFLVEECKEESATFHDRLAELYLKSTLAAKKRNEKEWTQLYSKLLKFIDSTNHYRIDRLYNIIASKELWEARAILLGRFGRHDQALALYVYRLQDYMKPELFVSCFLLTAFGLTNPTRHCSRHYRADSDTSSVYLTLLWIYLRPNSSSTKPSPSDLLEPAPGLISRHSSQLDSVAALELLPPLVPTADVRKFLINALHAPVFDTRVVRNLNKARGDQVGLISGEVRIGASCRKLVAILRGREQGDLIVEVIDSLAANRALSTYIWTTKYSSPGMLSGWSTTRPGFTWNLVCYINGGGRMDIGDAPKSKAEPQIFSNAAASALPAAHTSIATSQPSGTLAAASPSPLFPVNNTHRLVFGAAPERLEQSAQFRPRRRGPRKRSQRFRHQPVWVVPQRDLCAPPMGTMAFASLGVELPTRKTVSSSSAASELAG
ncbi:Rab guanyl-nucleotide exchange factor [Mycena kentingensis (nom. inval.)]|nr:Rab guanyl-nucleotide exchange factor [Mycena kentingensis (nom. inval.)]